MLPSPGVLHNLSREYGAAVGPRGVSQRRRGAAVRLTSSCEQVSSFERALELRPEEHSLWSKPLLAAM